MKKTAFAFVIATSVFFSFLTSNVEARPTEVQYREGSLQFDFDTLYFRSNENFDSNGKRVGLADGNSFQVVDFNSQLRWGLFDDFGILGGFAISASESSNSVAVRKNSTLSAAWIGADYRFLNYETFEMAARFLYSQALDTYDLNTDAVMNNNGVNQMIPGVDLIVPTSFARFYASLGYNIRSGGFSTLLPYNVGAEFAFSDLRLSLGIMGASSISEDKETAQSIQRDIVINRVNAGSKKFFAVNPNETLLDTAIRYQVSDNLSVNGNFNYSLIGSNAASGWTVGAGITWEFSEALSGAKKKLLRPKSESDIARDPTPADFLENTEDGVNQQYFQQPSPTTQKPSTSLESIENSNDSSSQPAPTKKTKPKDELKIKLKRKK